MQKITMRTIHNAEIETLFERNGTCFDDETMAKRLIELYPNATISASVKKLIERR